MIEIGGYIELDEYTLPMLHEGAVALNCGRNALAYLIRQKGIKKILLPKFLCSSVQNVCKRENVEIRYYSIGIDFVPGKLKLESDEWLYIVNYYGQVDNIKIKDMVDIYERVIVDQAQSYFQLPVKGVDTLYSCRKFFGVADGAFLYTDSRMDGLQKDESFERMHFLLGRFERTGSEFYEEYAENNRFFAGEEIKQMSKLTNNLLHAIDYEKAERRRTENFRFLHEKFKTVNKLQLTVPQGAFMYPLYIDGGGEMRKKLQKEKIYIPVLWPDVFDICSEEELECDMARNIIPLPCDQRYSLDDMNYLIGEIMKCMN